MDYEKKYKEALEKARQLCAYPTTKPFISDLQNLFPELKESEDDKIREDVISFVEQAINAGYGIISKERKEKWIAWLEKQGEKSAEWSEEDEKFVHGLIRGLAAKRDIHGHTTFSSDCIDITKTINWLKSLRPQLQWKLNEEQIKNELNKAANEWECKASFSPTAMVMDGDRPIGIKQQITSHADSFKAGVDWIIKKLRED